MSNGNQVLSAPRLRATASGSSDDWAKISQECQSSITVAQKRALAKDLRIRVRGLNAIQIGWHNGLGLYTFPEVNARQEVVGISLRSLDGEKSFWKGGHRGLIVPEVALKPKRKPLFIVEGATDTAALAGLGVAVIGRPSVDCGLDHVVEFLKLHGGDRQIVVMGEMDAKYDGTWPGRDQAMSFATKLSRHFRHVNFTLPPDGSKDVRAMIAKMFPVGGDEND